MDGAIWDFVLTAVMADHFNHVIAVSPRLKSDLVARYGVAAAKVDIIANGVDTERFQPGEGAVPRRAIYVGRIEDVPKNVFLLPKILARALTHDPGAHLTVVGSGPDPDRLQKRFLALGLDGHFELLGRVDSSEIPAILRQHGVFILPSRFEGCSNSTLEAMACGCVPIVSRLPGISDHMVIQDHTGFLFPSDDWKGMGDAWGQLIRSDVVWAQARLEARNQVVSKFSLDRMAEAYRHLFQAVMTESDPRPLPKLLDDFALDSRLGPTWRRWIPESVKKSVRILAARFGFSP